MSSRRLHRLTLPSLSPRGRETHHRLCHSTDQPEQRWRQMSKQSLPNRCSQSGNPPLGPSSPLAMAACGRRQPMLARPKRMYATQYAHPPFPGLTTSGINNSGTGWKVDNTRKCCTACRPGSTPGDRGKAKEIKGQFSNSITSNGARGRASYPWGTCNTHDCLYEDGPRTESLPEEHGGCP
ncbi:hypothetical protein LY76DRAFT_257431 [Colletotrichum caudatum]|nr:hypothetical protein LY76DRAFT_257431 [Colletotrichum caudatum]